MALALIRQRPRRDVFVGLIITALLGTFTAVGPNEPARAISVPDPYTVPQVVDTNPDPNIVETTLVADEATIDIGVPHGAMTHVMAFNGTVPGPEFRLEVGNTVIVHFENHLDADLDHPEKNVTGIHWHGIELNNASDGTPLTQNQVPPGGTFLYKFKVTRPGIYWYHPHHAASTNQVFKGLYGPIVITDPHEAALISNGVLPPASQTRTLALSDVTVCKEAPNNDPVTYPADPLTPWAGNPPDPYPGQAAPFPKQLCEEPMDDHGEPLCCPLAAGDVPNIQPKFDPCPGQPPNCRVNEGQTVLTNGVNVGARGGTPEAPEELCACALKLDVRPGQGLRLQIGNAATTRFFRLRLTDNNGVQIPLIRVGGQGGLLDHAREEGGVTGTGFDFKYKKGEILLDPGDRADVVAAIPPTASGVATLWTLDFDRTGQGFANVPTVPVAHLNITGRQTSRAYTIGHGTPLRASIPGAAVEELCCATGALLHPTTFTPPKTGMPTQQMLDQGDDGQDIKLTNTPNNTLGINEVQGQHSFMGDYTAVPHFGSTRYAKLGDILELTVTNKTNAHHPFHLHGFSIQPVDLTKPAVADPPQPAGPSYTFDYHEFLDNIDVPKGYTLRYRVHLDDRFQMDGITMGGGLGRWLFHCHIFFHAEFGMISELVVVSNDAGNERPFANDDAAQTPVGVNTMINVLANDSDPDCCDTLTVTGVSDPANGTATINQDNTVTYDPDGCFQGTDSFTYTVSDGNGGIAMATVTVRVRRTTRPTTLCP